VLKNISWLTFVAGVERIAALLQTILAARVLGITDYGVYGLLFGTIGLASSMAGLQMGLTATVFVSRFRETEKDKAVLVIWFTTRFALAVGLLFLLLTIPFAGPLSVLLLRSENRVPLILGCFLVVCSIFSGVQDGIVQGFEDFRGVAIARLTATTATVACVYPAGRAFGLSGVLMVILGGLVLRSVILSLRQRRHARNAGFPEKGGGLRILEMVLGFSLPSMLASMTTGSVGWLGSLMLSRQARGFDGLAIVSTGLQWCGPVLLIASSVSTVVVPALSRHYHRLDHESIKKILARTLLLNGLFATIAVGLLVSASSLILSLYGSKFVNGTVVFSIIVASSIPQVIAGVYMQHLVAKGRMWEQLTMYLFLVVPLGIGYLILVPPYHGLGFAVTQVVAWASFSTALSLTHSRSERKRIALSSRDSGSELRVAAAYISQK
jgi:O-antigen/teichoic acid export membrane protein